MIRWIPVIARLLFSHHRVTAMGSKAEGPFSSPRDKCKSKDYEPAVCIISKHAKNKYFFKYPVAAELEKTVVDETEIKNNMQILEDFHSEYGSLGFNRKFMTKAFHKVAKANRDAWNLKEDAQVEKWAKDMDLRFRSMCFIVCKNLRREKPPKWATLFSWSGSGDTQVQSPAREPAAVAPAVVAPAAVASAVVAPAAVASTTPTRSMAMFYGWHSELRRALRKPSDDATAVPDLAKETQQPPEDADPEGPYIAEFEDGTKAEIATVLNKDVTVMFAGMKKQGGGAPETALWHEVHVATSNNITIKQKVDNALVVFVYEQGRGLMCVRAEIVGELVGVQPCLQPEESPTIQKAVEFLIPFAEAYAKGDVDVKEMKEQKTEAMKEVKKHSKAAAKEKKKPREYWYTTSKRIAGEKEPQCKLEAVKEEATTNKKAKVGSKAAAVVAEAADDSEADSEAETVPHVPEMLDDHAKALLEKKVLKRPAAALQPSSCEATTAVQEACSSSAKRPRRPNHVTLPRGLDLSALCGFRN